VLRALLASGQHALSGEEEHLKHLQPDIDPNVSPAHLRMLAEWYREYAADRRELVELRLSIAEALEGLATQVEQLGRSSKRASILQTVRPSTVIGTQL